MHFGDLLKKVIKKHGQDVLDNKDILWSILTDNGIRNNRDISPAQQTIIKELCKEGVFQRIYRDCSETRWELTFRQLSHHIISDNGRQEQLVNGLFLEIANALGFDVNATEWGKSLNAKPTNEAPEKAENKSPTVSKDPGQTPNTVPGNSNPEWVDLGLPSGTKWATCNVGTTFPTGFGKYFAWGETSDKEKYNWTTYLFSHRLLKYNHTDRKTTLDFTDDAASVHRGGAWRMPTNNEWIELMQHCTWNWTTLYGVTGYQVISRTNGAHIFLPAAGLRNGPGLQNVSSGGFYWSSDLRYPGDDTALCCHFGAGSHFWSTTHRNLGLTIRPVLDTDANKNGTRKPVAKPKTNNRTSNTNNPPKPQNDVSTKKSNNKWLIIICATLFIALALVINAIYSKDGDKVEQESSLSSDRLIDNDTSTSIDISSDSEVEQTTDTQDDTDLPVVEDDGLESEITNVEGTLYEWVDLGLPSGTKWATCNIGATTPSDIGDFFAWGETKTKTDFDWSNYLFFNGTLTKYNTDSKQGIIDKKIELEAKDDAAQANCGINWKVPSEDDWKELKTNCVWSISSTGCEITSKHNKNSIFLPFTGYIRRNQLNDEPKGYYWSSTLNEDRPLNAVLFLIEYSSGGPILEIVFTARCHGFPIRPVYKSDSGIIQDSIENTLTEIDSNNSKQLIVNTTYSAEWVDLGLPSGTKWATRNVGASSPTDFGKYFAWGETSDKNDYSWSTYLFSKSPTKYNNTDNKITLDPNDDAAIINCGGKWRMPTIDDWEELIKNCRWQWTTLNGTNGYQIKSANSEYSIFLPAAGLINGIDCNGNGLSGYYWSSSLLYSKYNETARCVNFYSDGAKLLTHTNRNMGLTIRPVLNTNTESKKKLTIR